MDTAENSHFISSLRLDNQQQDAQVCCLLDYLSIHLFIYLLLQEFTLVFLEALDRNLSKHPNGEPIRQAIKKRCSVIFISF